MNTVKELVEFKEERKAYVRDIQRVNGTPPVQHPVADIVHTDGAENGEMGGKGP